MADLLVKKIYEIIFKTICGESKSVRIDVVQHWYEDILQNYLQGLFYKLLPNKTLTYTEIRNQKKSDHISCM